MAVEYLSKDWFVEWEKLMKEAYSTPSRIFTGLVEVFTDCPDGTTKWIEIQFVKGILTVFNFGEGEAPKAKFRIIGKYEDQVKVMKGELDPEAALIRDVFAFEGNIVMAIPLMGVYKKIVEIRRGVDTAF